MRRAHTKVMRISGGSARQQAAAALILVWTSREPSGCAAGRRCSHYHYCAADGIPDGEVDRGTERGQNRDQKMRSPYSRKVRQFAVHRDTAGELVDKLVFLVGPI
jgi:hypothetical protein